MERGIRLVGKLNIDCLTLSKAQCRRALSSTRLGTRNSISYVTVPFFSIRAPSGTLRPIQDYMGGHLALFLPQAERAIIGLRGPVGDGRLIVMFNRRKNLPRGCIMSRPCFRKLSDRAARQLGPERASWPLITKRVRSGNKLPPSTTIRGLTRILRQFWVSPAWLAKTATAGRNPPMRRERDKNKGLEAARRAQLG